MVSRGACFASVLLTAVLVVAIVAVVVVVMRSSHSSTPGTRPPQDQCSPMCKFDMVESIPENLTFPAGAPSHPSTFSALQSLLRSAEHSVDIAAFYWTLRGSDIGFEHPSARQGEELFELMKQTGRRGVRIRIAQNKPFRSLGGSKDSAELQQLGLAEVRSLDFRKLLKSGVLHTKFWIVDQRHFYLGSANMDWRSLTQVKELGAYVTSCDCLASDLSKVFDVYWRLGVEGATVPPKWPSQLSTFFNSSYPFKVALTDGQPKSSAYISSSPPPFSPSGREQDVDAILKVIRAAEEFVHIAVMDYAPTTLFMRPNVYWPIIDDALRAAAFDRGVHVKLLFSQWNHTKHTMYAHMRSLNDLNGALRHGSIELKLFEVPAFTASQAEIPYARVNHNKYMVTEKTAYIGTSNWSADYFITTGGVALVVERPANGSDAIADRLNAVFMRDWQSVYSHPFPA